MYGWGGSKNVPKGFADSDRPSERVIERRRNEDIEFLSRIKTLSRDELEKELENTTVQWRLVALNRAIKHRTMAEWQTR